MLQVTVEWLRLRRSIDNRRIYLVESIHDRRTYVGYIFLATGMIAWYRLKADRERHGYFSPKILPSLSKALALKKFPENFE